MSNLLFPPRYPSHYIPHDTLSLTIPPLGVGRDKTRICRLCQDLLRPPRSYQSGIRPCPVLSIYMHALPFTYVPYLSHATSTSHIYLLTLTYIHPLPLIGYPIDRSAYLQHEQRRYYEG